MDIDWLISAAIFSVLLNFAVLVLALAELRFQQQHGYIDAPPTKPEQRAQALLKEWLRPEQRRSLERHGYFDVRGSHSGRCYRIHRGRSMNIDELDKDGERVASWCFGPTGHLPLGDVMLAQKLALETDEQAALTVANLYRDH